MDHITLDNQKPGTFSTGGNNFTYGLRGGNLIIATDLETGMDGITSAGGTNTEADRTFRRQFLNLVKDKLAEKSVASKIDLIGNVTETLRVPESGREAFKTTIKELNKSPKLGDLIKEKNLSKTVLAVALERRDEPAPDNGPGVITMDDVVWVKELVKEGKLTALELRQRGTGRRLVGLDEMEARVIIDGSKLMPSEEAKLIGIMAKATGGVVKKGETKGGNPKLAVTYSLEPGFSGGLVERLDALEKPAAAARLAGARLAALTGIAADDKITAVDKPEPSRADARTILERPSGPSALGDGGRY